MFKRFMRSTAVQAMLGFILAAYMVLVKYTTRWTSYRFDQVEPIIEDGKGFVGLVWHSRFLMLNAIWKRQWQNPHILISLSRDGALVAYTTRFLKLRTIRGSARKTGSTKTKGGSRALREMLSAIENNDCVVITPDGPRGPRQRLGDGPLRLAKMSSAPVLTCAMSVKNRIQFNSWDRFILPLPFGRGVIIWGTPISVPSDANDAALEKLKVQIETEMNELLKEADLKMGKDPVLPRDPKGAGS